MTDRNINELKRLVKRWREIARLLREENDKGVVLIAHGRDKAANELEAFIRDVEARGKGNER